MDGGIDRLHRLLVRPLGRSGRLRVLDAILIFWFTLLSAGMVFRPIIVGLKEAIGLDAIIYTQAARALLAGGNPWRAEVWGIGFAAPPPSLLPYIPLVWLPDAVVGWLGAGVAFACAVYSLRKLKLPMWWLLFPPVVIGIAAGSSTLPMLALMVRGGVFAEATAVVVRVYAAVPLGTLFRWRSLVVAAILLAVTAPFLAWPTYIADREHISEVLGRQSSGGLSATAIPVLIPIAIGLLLLIGRRRAAWLLVPALWPNAMLHYGSIALPVLAEMPIVAIAMAPFLPGMIVAGLAGQTFVDILGRLRTRRGAAAVGADAAGDPAADVSEPAEPGTRREGAPA